MKPINSYYIPGKLYMLDPSSDNFPTSGLLNNYRKYSALYPIAEIPYRHKDGHLHVTYKGLTTDEQTLFNKQTIPFMFIKLHPKIFDDYKVTYLEFLVFHKKCFVKDMNLEPYHCSSQYRPKLINYIP